MHFYPYRPSTYLEIETMADNDRQIRCLYVLSSF
jgi:hypothetical protein